MATPAAYAPLITGAVQVAGAPAYVNTAEGAPLRNDTVKLQVLLLTGTKGKLPAFLGVPLPVNTTVCGPVVVKVPLPEKNTPFEAVVVMLYVPFTLTFTANVRVLVALSAVPTL